MTVTVIGLAGKLTVLGRTDYSGGHWSLPRGSETAVANNENKSPPIHTWQMRISY